mmetsp:Transcript_49046/g.131264  ORF Transcript_49046/g.131264 Transcript_49046/m.131264 type:complete len:332 (-) Transcript_49046:681-1676(-)
MLFHQRVLLVSQRLVELLPEVWHLKAAPPDHWQRPVGHPVAALPVRLALKGEPLAGLGRQHLEDLVRQLPGRELCPGGLAAARAHLDPLSYAAGGAVHVPLRTLEAPDGDPGARIPLKLEADPADRLGGPFLAHRDFAGAGLRQLSALHLRLVLISHHFRCLVAVGHAEPVAGVDGGLVEDQFPIVRLVELQELGLQPLQVGALLVGLALEAPQGHMPDDGGAVRVDDELGPDQVPRRLEHALPLVVAGGRVHQAVQVVELRVDHVHGLRPVLHQLTRIPKDAAFLVCLRLLDQQAVRRRAILSPRWWTVPVSLALDVQILDERKPRGLPL